MFNSQTKQDVFVHKLLQKTHGYFLDIGAGTGGLRGYPQGFYSNSYFFENCLSWKGIAIDYDIDWYNEVKSYRTCTLSCVDLLQNNINEVLEHCSCPTEIDYLSIDVDDAQLKVFTEFDWSKYRFQVLTLEHNLFQSFDECSQNHTEEHKSKIRSEYKLYRDTLRGHGYEILWGNVELDGYGPVEDWWVSKEVYDNLHWHQKYDVNCKEADYVILR